MAKTFQDYQNEMKAYERAHMGSSHMEYGPPSGYGVDREQGPAREVWDSQPTSTDPYNDWLATLPPEQQAEYRTLDNQHFAEGSRKNLMKMAALGAAGLGGIAALGPGVAGLGSFEGTLLGGLGGAAGGGSVPSFSGNAGGMSLGGGSIGADAGALAGSMASGSSAFDPMAAYLTSGGVDGSMIGSGVTNLTGAAGGAGGWGDILSSLGGSKNLLNVGGNLLGSYLSSNAAGKAVDAQVRAGQDSNALAKSIYDQNRADMAPYREAGTSALAGIQRLLANPNSITESPDYQFQFNEGQKALNNGAASRGMTYSGAQGKALQRYGNDYAGTKLDQSFNRLASLAGIGQTANTVGTAAGQNYANNAGQTMQGVGNAQGSGYVGSANSWNQGIGNALNSYNQNDLITALLNRKGP